MRWGRLLGVAALLAWAVAAWWGTHKPLPPGTRVAAAASEIPEHDVTFIADITAADAYGRPVVSQGIFDEVLKVARGARSFIVLDYARFGAADFGGEAAPAQRALGAQLEQVLLEQHRSLAGLHVLFITDPVNDDYGAQPDASLESLRDAGIDVVLTDLSKLRDSNPLYTAVWRLAFSWWDGPGSPLRGASQRLNFKSDHRKLIVADDGAGGLVGVVGSANPRDDESAWSNAAVRVQGAPLAPLLASELALARVSGWQGDASGFVLPRPLAAAASDAPLAADAAPQALSLAKVQILTEGATRAVLLARLAATMRGQAIDVAAFYLADRDVIEELLAADARGVSVRVLLDPDAGSGASLLSGLPNQPVASELESRSGGAIRVRWYRTHGERFHTSLVAIYSAGRLWLTVGSANLTRRSLDDYDLEANAVVEVARGSALASQLLGYFDTLWNNRAALGIEYSSDFAVYADPAQTRYWLGRALEASGLSVF